MDYFETLRSNGWLADPGERVRVVAIHAEGCLTRWGRPCSCDPRLVLAADPLSKNVWLIDNDLPTLNRASGE
jgi:hypothetical protein